MGCTGSSASDEHAVGSETPRRPVLSESEAWDIALAWRDPLRGCVRLQLDCTTEEFRSSILRTFEWVTFVFDSTGSHGASTAIEEAFKTAAYARAATIAWFALSCCEGYSGTENPQFWRRVFCELLYSTDDLVELSEEDTSRTSPQIPITDAIRFFHHPDRPFPRISLYVAEPRARGYTLTHDDEATTVACVFSGTLPHVDKMRDTKLKGILTKLLPLMRVSDVKRWVPVAMPMSKTSTRTHTASSDGDLEMTDVVSVRSLMEFPQLYVRSMALVSTTMLSIHSLHSPTPTPLRDVEVILDGDLPSFFQDHELCRDLQSQLIHASGYAENRRLWRVTGLQMARTIRGSYPYLGVLSSALPHPQGLETPLVQVRPYKQAATASDWSWLGYAIFHPDAASTSALTNVDIALNAISPGDIAALTNMAVGNNLLGGTSTGYLEGRVRCGAKVWASPASDGGASVHTFTAESWVGMCDHATDTTVQLEDWVCVVVPGYGLGWIRPENVVEIRNRRPGESCVRVLAVHCYLKNAAREESLLGLLRVLGDRLTTLHFDYSEAFSASTVQGILRLCPRLKSLRIHHDGSFWADERLAMDSLRLEELQLSLKGCSGPLLSLQELKPACLPHLKALRVMGSTKDSYKQHERALLSFLSKQPILEYFQWSHGSDMIGTWKKTPSYQTNGATREFLEQLPAECQVSHGPLRLNCRVAFLSVVRRSVVSRLGEDVVALIFDYATSSSPRGICINP